MIRLDGGKHVLGTAALGPGPDRIVDTRVTCQVAPVQRWVAHGVARLLASSGLAGTVGISRAGRDL